LEVARALKVVSYFPKDPAALLELQRRAAELHAAFAADYIAKLSCPKEQKMELLNAVIKRKVEHNA
jgi:hypothetical protein